MFNTTPSARSLRSGLSYLTGLSGLFLFVSIVGFSLLLVIPYQGNAATVFSCPNISTDKEIKKPDQELANRTAKELREKNMHIRERGSSFSADNSDDRQTLVTRKEFLTTLMRNDPDAAAREVFSDASRASKNKFTELARSTAGCMETEVSEEGEVQILHADYLNNGSVERYTLQTVNGETLTVHLPKALRGEIRLSGEKFVIRGMRIGSELVPDISRADSITPKEEKFSLTHALKNFVKTAYAAIPSSMGPQKTLVVMAYFQDGALPSLPQAVVNDTVFNQVNNYYLRTSYDKTSISGNSINWIKLPVATTCDYDAVRNATIAAVDGQVDFRNYQALVIIAPFNCGWAGLGSIGKFGVSTGDGVVPLGQIWIASDWANRRFISHELGHTLGVSHAGYLNCGSASVSADPSGAGCTVSEYGDYFDVMGASEGEMNAPHREYVGWFDATNVRRVTQNATLTIEPLETKTFGIKTLRIPRSANMNDDLYLEYRQPLGYDNNFGAGANVYSGISIHTMGGYAPQLVGAVLPANPNAPALTPGKTFIDPATGTSISVVSANTSGALVNIAFQSASVSPSGTAIPPATQIIDTAGSAWTVSGGVVYRNGAATISSSVILLLYWNNVVYQQNSFGGWWSWVNGGWQGTSDPRAPAPDTTAPSVPVMNAPSVISTSQINLSWTASTDNVGVTGYRLERCLGASCTAWAQIASPASSPYTNTGLAANTTYRYRIRAADAAGNLSGYSAIVTATTPTTFTESLHGTTITTTGTITDATGAQWTIVGGVIYKNGVATVSSSVILLLYWNNVVYQQNSFGGWWSWVNNAWQATTDPRAGGGTWTKIANEGKSFTVSGTKQVRYGADSRWIMKSVTGNGQCTSAFFGGDPAPGVRKSCQVQVP